MSFASFQHLKDDVLVVRIQKGFLVWNICNPFVVESATSSAKIFYTSCRIIQFAISIH